MAEVTSTSTSTYDYSMIGSVGSEAAQSVNGDMINKIRAGEEASLIDPITEDIDNISIETEKLEEIKAKVTEFQDVVNYFDIYNEENVFNQYLFDGTGSSAVFDAVDMSSLKEGTTTIDITQLAQKDVFQSAVVASETAAVPSGTLTINGVDFDTSQDDANTYEKLAGKIEQTDGLTASVEQVGDNSYRLVIKSEESGTLNSVNISGLDLGFDTGKVQIKSDVIDPTSNTVAGDILIKDTNGVDVTFSNDGTESYADLVTKINDNSNFNASINDDNEIVVTMTDGSEVLVTSDAFSLNLAGDNLNHTLKAQNMNATIDGIEYDVSSSSITTQGSLKVTGLELGVSSITVSKDTSAVAIAAETMVTKYNELQEMLNEEIYSEEAGIEDKSMLRNILSDMKSMLFANYGAAVPEYGDAVDEYGDVVKAHSNVTNNDINLFVLGFELDKSGNLVMDSDIFNSILNGEDDNYDFDDLQNVFTGSYSNKGVGVQLNDYLDALDGYNGTFYDYDIDIIEKKEKLEEEKENELERLDAKYGIMAEQFASYSSVISQMESSFNGLKMMIDMESSDS